MKFKQTILAAALVAGTGVAQAEVSANLGVASNYYFRGITQTDDSAAVSGGIDYGHESGFYVGTWMSNVDFSSSPKADVEIDGYVGFGGDIGDTGLSYDLSAWYYWYPSSGGDSQGGELDYGEAAAILSWEWLTATLAYTFWAEADDLDDPLVDAAAQAFQDGDIYFEVAVAPDWEYEGFAPSASVGYYAFDQDGDTDLAIQGGGDQDLNYTNWTIGITRDAGDFGSLSFNYVQVDFDGNSDEFWDVSDGPQFWLGWAKDF